MKKILFAALAVLTIVGCNQPIEKESSTDNSLVYIEGEAQGTTYHIKYLDAQKRDFKVQMDSILKKIDESMSTYLPTSLISELNSQKLSVEVDKMFLEVLQKSFEVQEKTNGAFDVTLAPVINAWGWGFKNKEKIDSALIDSLMQFVGRAHFTIQGNTVTKDDSSAMLDFNAIAQGYSADVLANFLKANFIENFMVELGGEVVAQGVNENNEVWRLGIDKPVENAETRELSAVLSLDGKALATSGNYRKFYEEDGVKYSHTINPENGYPVRHSLLSASVVADDAMTADAYATCFMVMGLEKSIEFLATDKSLDAFLIYSDSTGQFKTFQTKGLESKLEMIEN